MGIGPLIPLIVSGVLCLVLMIGYYQVYLQHPYQVVDRSSVANINEVLTEHYVLNLSVNFQMKKLHGSITHTFRALSDGVDRIHLDIQGIHILDILDPAQNNKSMPYHINAWDWLVDDGNSVLTIDLAKPLSKNDKINLQILYETDPEGGGVNWLNEKQTKTGSLFFYTDCQTHFCRSVAPLQDTPAVKSTFEASVTADRKYTVLVSGIKTGQVDMGDKIMHSFKQENPLASYLLAIVAGVLEAKKTGPRTIIYAEPPMMNVSITNLQHMSDFIDIIESDLIPFKWKHYAIIVMPFPYSGGGMENPEMIYLCPSVVMGGRAAERLFAHELVHSWFGNLITCKNWGHTWINEGFTVYGERRILEVFFGQEYYDTIAASTLYEYDLAVKDLAPYPEYTKLTPYTNRLPPYGFLNTIVYEKGFTFLKKLERLIGKKNLFSFFKAYLTAHAYKSVSTDEFTEDFIQYVTKNVINGSEILKTIDWQMEYRKEGMSIPRPVYNNSGIAAARCLAKEYVELNGTSPPNPQRYQEFYTNLRVIFVIELVQLNATGQILERVDIDQRITESEQNPEILFYWILVNTQARLMKITKIIEAIVGTYGRNRYLYPIYRGMIKANKTLGLEIFNKYKWLYTLQISKNIQNMFS